MKRLVCLILGHVIGHYCCGGCASLHDRGCEGGNCGRPFCYRCGREVRCNCLWCVIEGHTR